MTNMSKTIGYFTSDPQKLLNGTIVEDQNIDISI